MVSVKPGGALAGDDKAENRRLMLQEYQYSSLPRQGQGKFIAQRGVQRRLPPASQAQALQGIEQPFGGYFLLWVEGKDRDRLSWTTGDGSRTVQGQEASIISDHLNLRTGQREVGEQGNIAERMVFAPASCAEDNEVVPALGKTMPERLGEVIGLLLGDFDEAGLERGLQLWRQAVQVADDAIKAASPGQQVFRRAVAADHALCLFQNGQRNGMAGKIARAEDDGFGGWHGARG